MYIDHATLTAGQRARVEDAIAELNRVFQPYNVQVVSVPEAEKLDADALIGVAATSPCGSAADGVLGCMDHDGYVTLLSGWSWFEGSSPSDITSGQYDLQTIVTHELGHVIGLAHSGQVASVMHEVLATGSVKRSVVADDMKYLDGTHDGASGLYAADPLTGRVGMDTSVVFGWTDDVPLTMVRSERPPVDDSPWRTFEFTDGGATHDLVLTGWSDRRLRFDDRDWHWEQEEESDHAAGDLFQEVDWWNE